MIEVDTLVTLALRLSPYAQVVYFALAFVAGLCTGAAIASPDARWRG